MKRHPELIPLSKDHHEALVAASRLRRGLKNGTPSEILKNYALHLRKGLVVHFRKEEEAFLGVAGLDASQPLIRQLLNEHKQFEGLFNAIQAGSSAAIEKISDLLTRHVRFEERELFPFVEATLSQAALAEVGQILSSPDQSLDIDWVPPFWE